jgi:hypothetical protein
MSCVIVLPLAIIRLETREIVRRCNIMYVTVLVLPFCFHLSSYIYLLCVLLKSDVLKGQGFDDRSMYSTCASHLPGYYLYKVLEEKFALPVH